MAQRNIIAIGQTGSGKSWFLNELLGKKEFAETPFPNPSKSEITTKSKSMKDNVNNIEYTLNLYDTPDFAQNSEHVLDTLKKVMFYQIVIVFIGSKEGLEGLEPIAKLLKQMLSSSSDHFTLVMNQMAKDIKDESLIELFREAKSILGLDTNECICLKIGEKPKDGIFKYFLWSPDGEHQFQERNFLSIVGQMNQLIVPELKQQQNPNAQSGRQLNCTPSNLTNQVCYINISGESNTVPIIYWILSILLVLPIILVLIIYWCDAMHEKATILSIGFLFLFLMLHFMFSTYILFNWLLKKYTHQLNKRQEDDQTNPLLTV